MKNYVTRLSYAEEWEMMKMAIAKKDTNLICNMLRDGYDLTLPLLEAVYRFINKASLFQIVKSYPNNLENDQDCIMFLKERLNEQQFKELITNNRVKMEKIAKEEALEKRKQFIKSFEEAEQTYGDSNAFYCFICGSTETFEHALDKYGEDAIYKAMDKHGVLYQDNERTLYDTWYLRWFSFEYLMSQNHIKAAIAWLTSAISVHNIDNYDECLLRIVNAGGLKDLIIHKAPLGYGRLFEDESIRNKVKAMGAIGYERLFCHAKQSFSLDDWYQWYELDSEEALKHCHSIKVPKVWLLKHKHFSYAFGI